MFREVIGSSSAGSGVLPIWGRPQRQQPLPNEISASRDITKCLSKRQQRHAVVFPRGGYGTIEPSSFSSPLVRIIGTITQLLISMGKAVLPPMVGGVTTVVRFYKALPIDAITAQIGLVYCFLGGYYPTLFSSLQAAKYCGWSIMVSAIAELTDQAINVIDEIDEQASMSDIIYNQKDLFLQQTNIVLKTVDPMKINQAATALYTTWLGISTVLRQEYARVINLSLTLASGIERISYFILQVPLNLVTPREYQKWIPAVIGWISKGIAMRIAWRIERVLTASTSAIAGGAMFARSVIRMINNKYKHNRGRKKKKQKKSDLSYDDDENTDTAPSLLENMIGIAVGGIGFYTQIEYQYKKNFSFEIPFPITLITWPFDLAERWIQWYITKY